MASLFTRAWSLVEDSDIVPARALLEKGYAVDCSDGKMAEALYDELRWFYPFLWSDDVGAALAAHYENYYTNCEGPKTGLKFQDIRATQRFHAIASVLRQMPPGLKVIDWGCAEGSMILNLARELPNMDFYGADISQAEIDALHANAALIGGPRNFKGGRVVRHNDPSAFGEKTFDIALACEVLEHVPEPWATLEVVEGLVRPRGWIIITTPQGPWELMGCREQGAKQWPWRAHIWHLTAEAYLDETHGMIRDKEGRGCGVLNPGGPGVKRYARGHVMVGYRADHKPIPALDPLWKAGLVNLRPTMAIRVPDWPSEHVLSNVISVIDGMGTPPVAASGLPAAFYAERPWIRDWYSHREVSLELTLTQP